MGDSQESGYRMAAIEHSSKSHEALHDAALREPTDSRRTDALLLANTQALLALQNAVSELSVLIRVSRDERRNA